MKAWLKEVIRVGPLAVLAAVVILPDDSKHVVLFGVGIIALAVILAHVIRKLLFPYIDMRKLIDGIEDDTKASAIVLVGLIYLLSTIIQSLVALLR
jgi:hypothetical protein